MGHGASVGCDPNSPGRHCNVLSRQSRQDEINLGGKEKKRRRRKKQRKTQKKKREERSGRKTASPKQGRERKKKGWKRRASGVSDAGRSDKGACLARPKSPGPVFFSLFSRWASPLPGGHLGCQFVLRSSSSCHRRRGGSAWSSSSSSSSTSPSFRCAVAGKETLSGQRARPAQRHFRLATDVVVIVVSREFARRVHVRGQLPLGSHRSRKPKPVDGTCRLGVGERAWSGREEESDRDRLDPRRWSSTPSARSLGEAFPGRAHRQGPAPATVAVPSRLHRLQGPLVSKASCRGLSIKRTRT